MMSAGVASAQRFTARQPCPVCGGHSKLPGADAGRCYGFLGSDGRYARCTRKDFAGGLDQNDDGTYSHFLEGSCRCGAIHGDLPRQETITQNGRHRRVIREGRDVLHNIDGQPLCVHRRKYFDDGTKDVWWEQLDGTLGLGGVKVVDLPLAGVHELKGVAVAVVTEGEPARDALVSLGIAAVGTVCGAKAAPRDEHLRPLIGLDVRLWPDADKDGIGHMRKIARRLIAMGQPREQIRIVAWSEAPEKGDATDFVADGATSEDVRRLLDGAEDCDAFLSDAPKEEVSSERKITFRTARQIAELTAEEPEFVAGPFIVAGGITDIDGKAKAAGKTTWMLALSRAVVDGATFMGYPTQKSPVVYLTEQPPASFRQALARAGLLDRDDFHVLFWHDTIGVEWPGIVAAAVSHCKSVDARLLGIDTLPQFAGMKGDAENNAGEAMTVVQPLQEAAAHGLAVAMLRHERKSGGNVGDSARGSSAFTGSVDIVLSLRRAEGASRPTIRHLHALSRFDETPDLLVIELTSEGYISLGTETAVAEAEARDAILNAAPTSEADAIKEADLIEATGVKRTNGRKAVEEHLAAGRLIRVGAGKKGDAFRYWRPAAPKDAEKDADKTPDLTASEGDQASKTADSNVSDSTQEPLSESKGASICAQCGATLSLDDIFLCASCRPAEPDEDEFVGAAVGGDDEWIEELF